MKKPIISASILNVNFMHLKEKIQELKDHGIKWIHYDVMDGNFVSEITFGAAILRDLKRTFPDLIYDCHLMVMAPDKHIIKFAPIQPNIITVHFEVLNYEEVVPTLTLVKERKMRVGLSIKPKTNIEQIYEYLEYVDVLLVMAVEPGAGGQSFILNSLDKIKKLAKYRTRMPLCNYLISVDGGVNDRTGQMCLAAGADILVSGSYLINSKNLSLSLKALQ